jgi:pimeloyl-ACP methyl ester carboxylesterase
MTHLHLAWRRAAVAAAAAAAVLGLGRTAAAQVDRYELGLRLRAFERRLEATTDPARRRGAYGELDRAVQAFFRLDTTTVAKAIAAADEALAGDATSDQRFAASLRVEAPSRLVDPRRGPVALRLAAAFATDVELPADLVWCARLDGEASDRLRQAVRELPVAATIDLADAAAGDRTLTWELRRGDRVLLTRTQGLSLAADASTRLAAIDGAAGERDRQPASLEAGTLDLLAGMCAGMTKANAEETVLPGARLLAEAEALAAAIAADKPHYTATSLGQFWLRVPTGRSATVVRLQTPEKPPADGARAPLVLALHGAGGSENLFFDGYGDGAIAPRCRERGWFLVAPRLGMMGGGDLAALVDALAARFPIDPQRVVVVGHSMGAAAAMAATGRAPERFRAVAALGGGGSVPRKDSKAPPFFVGVGSRDFALAGAQRLHAGLQSAGFAATLREYPDVEHLAIVQIALPDVFAFFDGALAGK